MNTSRTKDNMESGDEHREMICHMTMRGSAGGRVKESAHVLPSCLSSAQSQFWMSVPPIFHLR